MESRAIFVTLFVVLPLVLPLVFGRDCTDRKGQSKLFCYFSKVTDVDTCHCSHVILPANSDLKSVVRLKEQLTGVKILITVHEFNEGLINIFKNSSVDGVEVNLKKLDSRSDINDFISTVRGKLGENLYVVVSVPPKAEVLAKYYDFKGLVKSTDAFVLQTAFLGANPNVTFHPSRLSGLWDMQNIDSVVDLVSGLGAPLSKLVIASPVQAFQFTLQDEGHTAAGSPALEVSSIGRDALCSKMSSSNWTLERDQDQAGPYIFRKKEWIAFEDPTSIDIKTKYSRIRGLAGVALKDVSFDGGVKCGKSILEAAFEGLSKQARAPRGAVLHSLEREILESPARLLDTVQLSPYRITRIVDVEGHVHITRQDTRTEFECSRQGYFVHPRSCGRFYRCVKFDQLSDEFSVFEFDCPAGLAFDSRVEVCVWPGSLPHASPCSGSSEIAPVPKERFICPQEPGYYADPENCRWFFACLDHGKSPLSAYEFRCPFGLVFDQDRLICEWPWLVPKCGSGAGIYEDSIQFYGGLHGHGHLQGHGYLHGGHLDGLHSFDALHSGLHGNLHDGLQGNLHLTAQAIQPSNYLQLENYDGLGQLGTVTLGGFSGTLPETLTKVYSSHLNANPDYEGGSVLSANGYPEGHQNENYQKEDNENQVYENQGQQAHQKDYGSQGLHLSGAISTSNFQSASQDRHYSGYEDHNYSGFKDHSYSGLKDTYSGVQELKVGYETNEAQNKIAGSFGDLKVGLAQGSPSVETNGKLELNGGKGQELSKSFVYKADYLEPSGKLDIVAGGYSGVGSLDTNLGSSQSSSFDSTVHHSSAYDSSVHHSSNYDSSLHDSSLHDSSLHDFSHRDSSNHGFSNHDPTPYVSSAYLGYTNQGLAKHSVQITHLGSGINQVDQVSSTPVPYVSTSIPVVTSVPIPSLEPIGSYHGGVVANLPELQHRFVPSQPSGFYHDAHSGSYSSGGYSSGGYSSGGYSSGDYSSRDHSSRDYSSRDSSSRDYSSRDSSSRDYFSRDSSSRDYSSRDSSSRDYSSKDYFSQKDYSSSRGEFGYSNVSVVHHLPTTFTTVSTPAPPFVSTTVGPFVSTTLRPSTIAPSINYHQENFGQSGYQDVVQIQPAILVKETNKASVISQGYHHEKSEGYHHEKSEGYHEKSEGYHGKSGGYQGKSEDYQGKSEGYQEKSEGYHYDKPSYGFFEEPQGYQYEKPVQGQAVSQVQTNVYHDVDEPWKPIEKVELRPIQKIQHVQVHQPIQQVQVQPIQQVQVQPIQQVQVQPIQEVQVQEVDGYHYDRPLVPFEEKRVSSSTNHGFKGFLKNLFVTSTISPVSTSQSTLHHIQPSLVEVKSTVVPVVHHQVVSTTTRPAHVHQEVHKVLPSLVEVHQPVKYVSSYQPELNVQSHQPQRYQPIPSVAPPVPVVHTHEQSGYFYEKPSVQLVEEPVKVPLQPIQIPVQPIQNVPKVGPVLKQVKTQPAVSSYNFQQSNYDQSYLDYRDYQYKSSVDIQADGYSYEKPSIPFEDGTILNVEEPIKEEPFVSKQAYVTGHDHRSNQNGYFYEKPSLVFKEEPVVYSTLKPTIYGSSTPQPILHVPSTPKPTYTSTIASILPKNIPQSRPISRYSFSSFDTEFEHDKTSYFRDQVPLVEVTSARPTSSPNYITRPAYVEVTTPGYQSTHKYEPTIKYVPTPKFIEVTTPKHVTTPSHVVVTTPSHVVVTTPKSTYLPVKTTEYITVTTPKTTYLPVGSNQKLQSVSRGKTYIRVNDFQPFLPAKLGAQCTCVSNSIKLRAKPKEVAETYQSQNDFASYEEGYEKSTSYEKSSFENSNSYEKSSSYEEVNYEDEDSSVVVEDYKYEPKKVVVVTPTPEVVIKPSTAHSTTFVKPGPVYIPSTTPYFKEPSTTYFKENIRVTESPIIIEKTPATIENVPIVIKKVPLKTTRVLKKTRVLELQEKVTDEQIGSAVRTGLSLVKSAVKQGVKEGVKEALAERDQISQGRSLDRYGHGGWRQRDETLQGAIDCQRAGLFRHPSQCNKFYACRWDCNKNRFTLHVFNCPVHLTFDNNLGACNWPSQGPACMGDTLLPSE